MQISKDKYFFAQLTAFLDRNKSNYIVCKFNVDKYVKHYTGWNQLLALMLGQLPNRESPRYFVVALDAYRFRYYHLGMGKNISRSSMARANKDRDNHIFEEFVFLTNAMHISALQVVEL